MQSTTENIEQNLELSCRENLFHTCKNETNIKIDDDLKKKIYQSLKDNIYKSIRDDIYKSIKEEIKSEIIESISFNDEINMLYDNNSLRKNDILLNNISAQFYNAQYIARYIIDYMCILRNKLLNNIIYKKIKRSINKEYIIYSAIHIWTFIMFYFAKMYNFIIMLIITYNYNILTPDINPSLPVRIIKAIDNNGNDVTKKLKLYMKFYWDSEMLDNRGGIDLDNFTKFISSPNLCIIYILEDDIDKNIYSKFINMVNMKNKHIITESYSSQNSSK